MLSFGIVNYTCLDILFLVHDFQSFLCITLFEVLCTHWKLLHKNIALMYADQFHPLIINKTKKHSSRMYTAYLPTVCVVVASVGVRDEYPRSHIGICSPPDILNSESRRDMGPGMHIPWKGHGTRYTHWIPPDRQTDTSENIAFPKHHCSNKHRSTISSLQKSSKFWLIQSRFTESLRKV